MIYSEILKGKVKVPTSQKFFTNKLCIQDIEWISVYHRVYSLTNYNRLREFQYKILNNCLFLNHKLYKAKLVESPLCTFCKQSTESIEHFFVECKNSKYLYKEVNHWLKEAHIKLPSLNLNNVILGTSGDLMDELLFLLYKFVLFNTRGKKSTSRNKLLQKYTKGI